MPNTKPKLSGSEQVDTFFHQLDHPQKPAMVMIRKAILTVDGDITEHIKWNAPSFCHGGDDRVTFNIRKDGNIMLIFHRGAKVKDGKHKGRLIEDPTGLLKWLADDRATMQFATEQEVRDNLAKLTTVVSLWIAAASE